MDNDEKLYHVKYIGVDLECDVLASSVAEAEQMVIEFAQEYVVKITVEEMEDK